MVPYAGYQIAVPNTAFYNSTGGVGRGCFTSTKLNQIVNVVGNWAYLVNVKYDQSNETVTYYNAVPIGQLETSQGIVYITENNNPQICITDGETIYIYDPAGVASILPGNPVKTWLVGGLDFAQNFNAGYVTFHDSRFIVAASADDKYNPPANNTWRLCALNNDGTTFGTSWPADSSHIGLLETKPDNTQAVVRFPSKGNMILVMGSIVTEAWFDTGAQLFPYQRNNQFNIDYGCVSPATVAYMDEVVAWLGQNEKSGPIILVSTGGEPEKITTDGIDYLFAQLQNPQDSEAFLYRQDGHLFYHINFYSDNLSLFYDINTKKFYNACDQNFNYFIAGDVAFFGNQYYFTTKNNGNLFAFDTIFTTFQDVDQNSPPQTHTYVIPRVRICKNIRSASQDYFILNDIGFTIESGETNYYVQPGGDVYLITQDNFFLLTQDGYQLTLQPGTGDINTVPAVDLSLSYDGGASFGNQWRYNLPAIGQRRNRLLWWQCGMSNDIVPQFMFWGIGRFTCTDGEAHIRE